MKKPRVTLIDYGVGNLLSVRRAFEHVGAEVALSESPEEVANADRLVLPGVGAFGDGMAGLRARGLPAAIERYLERQRPFLGICLGMQLMMEGSEEFGVHQGLGIIPGQVRAIPAAGVEGRAHKIPHTGWNQLLVPPGRAGGQGSDDPWAGSLLAGLTPGAAVYFVHSFTAWPVDERDRLADCHYDGRVICAAISRGAVQGCQFHPEKSGPVGLQIIARFLSL